MTTITELSHQAERPTLRELPVDVGFEPPSERQFKLLMDVVKAAHTPTRQFVEETEDAERQLWLAFAAVGQMWRKVEPDTSRYFGSHVEDANAVLKRRWGLSVSLDGRAMLAAIIAHNDIPYRLSDARVGQPIEVALNPHAGFRCTNSWREVLAGRPLRPPLPPRFRVEKGSPMQVYVGR